ncbi:MAG TPA: ORF6N domain-containing protein [Verrucomicrobiae bacterium]|nr:ORF6N domain-containing protein [Verrucomicrobiae bacterium]
MSDANTTLFESQFIAHVRKLRGHAVILDSDLAWFLGIEAKRIADALTRRPELFPSDFVFQLTPDELRGLENESPCLTSHGLTPRKHRFAFTTHGVGMLLLAFDDDSFAMAAIPVLRAIQKFWRAEETGRCTAPLVNRTS